MKETCPKCGKKKTQDKFRMFCGCQYDIYDSINKKEKIERKEDRTEKKSFVIKYMISLINLIVCFGLLMYSDRVVETVALMGYLKILIIIMAIYITFSTIFFIKSEIKLWKLSETIIKRLVVLGIFLIIAGIMFPFYRSIYTVFYPRWKEELGKTGTEETGKKKIELNQMLYTDNEMEIRVDNMIETEEKYEFHFYLINNSDTIRYNFLINKVLINDKEVAFKVTEDSSNHFRNKNNYVNTKETSSDYKIEIEKEDMNNKEISEIEKLNFKLQLMAEDIAEVEVDSMTVKIMHEKTEEESEKRYEIMFRKLSYFKLK